VTEKQHQLNVKRITESIEVSNLILHNFSSGGLAHKSGSATLKKGFEGKRGLYHAGTSRLRPRA
jgi:hypothetical protein